jgi:hypothetical protein
MPRFHATGRAELSLCETNADLRRRVAEQYGVERTYAETGVNLLIEKPLSTLDEGIQTLRINLVMLTSSEQRGWQTID